METALVSLVCVAILLIGTVTTVFTSLKAATAVSDSLKSMEEEASSIRRTDIVASVASYGTPVVMWIANNGQTDLSDFNSWDIIAEYEQSGTHNVTYLTRASGGTPGDNEWALEGIYLPSSSAEVYDLNILNPGEQAKILIALSPALNTGTTVRLTISAENGVTSQCQLTRTE
jgi:hypothetical protein